MKSIDSLVLFAMLLFLSNTISQNQTKASKILIITSNQSTYGDSEKETSNHFGEIVFAYDVFKNAGFEIDFVSPEGGKIPIGYFDDSNKLLKQYRDQTEFMLRFEHTLTPSSIDASQYLAVYYSGGGAAMFGVPYNLAIQKISEEIYENNGVVSAVCHGTAGITQLKSKNGNYLFLGKRISGFPDQFERTDAPYFKTFPFSIETEIKQNGGNFVYSEKGWDGFYAIDGRLVTGQDPSASAKVAQAVIKVLNSIHN